MKERYFFEISYKGTAFYGWQKQPEQITVQNVIEDALTKIFSGIPIKIVGCGRTDTGVHASQYFFHTDLPENRFTNNELIYKLNGILPSSIAVHTVRAVENNHHARFDALSRTYHYFIHQKKDPFKTDISLYHLAPLDIVKMNEAAELLIGEQDFTSFSKLHTDVKTNICNVTHAKWSTCDKNELKFEITANRFLRNMVRAIVGTLLEVGKEKLTYKDVAEIITSKDRGKAGTSVSAHGLFLARIHYPFFDDCFNT